MPPAETAGPGASSPEPRDALDVADRIDVPTAVAIARESFGIEARASELPSYADQNFLLEPVGDARPLVLKVARAEEQERALTFEHDLQRRLTARGLPVQDVVLAPDGRELVRVPSGRLARVLTWLPGVPLAQAGKPGRALLVDLGATLGRLDEALLDVPAPGVRTRFRWDLTRAAEVLAEEIRAHVDRERRERMDRVRARLDAEVGPRLAALRRGVIHNDANDHNVLVRPEEPGRVAGLLDFGDALHTALVCEPAIALAYAMLGTDDPLAAASALLGGYQRALPLAPEEVALLPDLVIARLAVSVTLSSAERARRGPDPYRDVTEPHAWRLLARLEELGRERVAEAFVQAVESAA